MLSLAAYVSAPMWATVYYVDHDNGADSQDGQSPLTAWSSLKKIGKAGLAPGDIVLLRRGQIWGEQLSIKFSGIADAPVRIGAYGDGARPLIDGSRLNSSKPVDLIMVDSQSNIEIAGLEIRNSPMNGINVYNSSSIFIRDVVVSNSQRDGIITFDTSNVIIQDADVFSNSLDLSASYDGIQIDGNLPVRNVSIRNSTVHANLGGSGWNSANGIYIGHTTVGIPTLTGIEIKGNEVFANGNPNQNQSGRGIAGVFSGDVLISGNYIYRNASAGIYVGGATLNVDVSIVNNIFMNNALRQFGGYTGSNARAMRNAVFVDDPNITAMGAEIGGQGSWQLLNNAFYYMTGTTDTWRGFITLNDPTVEQSLTSDWNLFFTAGPIRFKRSDDIPIGFSQWQAAGFDRHSTNPR
jgi:hypothetical protein